MALAKQHDTFWAPSAKQLKQVKNGSTVKICNGKERFWVKVEGTSEKIVHRSYSQQSSVQYVHLW